VEVCVDHRGEALAPERRVPGQRLVQHAGQGVDVHPLVDHRVLEALRRDVFQGAHGGSGDGQRAAGADGAGDAEVRQVGEVAPGAGRVDEQHVGRLDVAVDQALRVGGVERVGHLGDHVDRAVWWQRAVLGQRRAQVGALDQPHVQVEAAVDVTVVVNGHDVRFAQPRGLLALAAEPLVELGVGGELGAKALERDGALVDGVEGAMNLAHPAASDQLLQAVRPEQFLVHSPSTWPDGLGRGA
jgi:hypothetical protein